MGTGGTMVGPAFSGFAQFAPPAAVLPPRGHHPAFYPQPILYWGYPSPPVSPTTYYGPASHPQSHHVAPPPPHQHQQTLVINFDICIYNCLHNPILYTQKYTVIPLKSKKSILFRAPPKCHFQLSIFKCY